jgi:hypothetical protein
MKDFLELLVKKFHLPEFLASYFMLVTYLITGSIVIFNFIRNNLKNWSNKKILSRDLHPYFTKREIDKYTRFYIPQYFQNITPSEGEELGRIYAAAARSKLMPEFLKKGLLTDSPYKYFIILSDTGMGKTAFLINLYKKYKLSRPKISEIKYNIALFPLGAKDSLSKIEKIEEKTNTILLLDSFDEDVKAIHDYQARMDEILVTVKDFRKVIFTCRTQFFPSKNEEPHDTNDITFGENVKHSFQKIYLSAFDNKDVLRYLIKKYKFNFYYLYKAYNLVKKSPNLMFRPMLLTYIADLINVNSTYDYSSQMYKVLIDKWVERESLKPAIVEKGYRPHDYKKNLLGFSYSLARNLYNERDKRGGYLISIRELKEIGLENSLDANALTIDDKTGRSLLNRNSVGQFKFAHKSILEYFLAVEIFNKPIFLNSFDFHGMDATAKFHSEMITIILKSGEGTYFVKTDPKPKRLSSLTPTQLKDVSTINITKSTELFANGLAGLSHLETLIFTDQSFICLYVLYIYICFDKDIYKSSFRQKDLKEYNFLIDEYRPIMQEISIMIPDLSYAYIAKLFAALNIESEQRARYLSFIDPTISHSSIQELDDFRKFVVGGKSEMAMVKNALEEIRGIYELSTYIKNVKVVF